MTPSQIATARLLAEAWDGPQLVSRYVLIGKWNVPLPDLTSDASGGTILGTLGGCDARQDGSDGTRHVNGHKAATLAHAAALAFLAVMP